MRYCHRCNASYENDASPCPDCGFRTFTEIEHKMISMVNDEVEHAEMVEVYRFDGPGDEAILTQIMSDAGVPFVVHDYQGGPFGTMFSGQKGWGVMYVDTGSVAKAKEVIAVYEALPPV